MGNKEVIDYVMNSPGNTNKAVLKGLLGDTASGGSGDGVFMVEYGTKGNTTILELKATWQEIYDAHASGKLVITHTSWAGPPELGVIMDEMYLVDGIAYLPGESRPYRVHFNNTWYRCESSDERRDTSNN